MSASVNPDIVTDGLVLCLDAANSDCFRGEPTVNKINGLYSTTFAGSGFTITNNYTTNFDGSDTASLLTSGSWIARTSGYSSGFTNGNTYTTTWILKRVDRDTVNLGWGGAHTGTRVNVSVNLANGTVSSASDPSLYGIYSLGNEWYAVWHVTTLSGTAHYPQLSSTLAGAKYLYGGMQVEEKSYPTPIVDGTRGSTVATGGGLVDLSGNNNNNATITRAATPASSFYSEENKGLWVFDGSTDRINLIEAPDRLADSCTEVWFKSNGSQGTQRSMIFGYEHEGSNFSETVTGPITLLSNNKIKATVITSTEVYRSVTSNTTINNNQFYHVCLNKDTVNGILSLYINGIFEISNTFDADNLSYWAGLYRGRNYVEIGGYYNSGSTTAGVDGNLNGSIGICKMYNRTLEPYEIYKNYKALKGRYGL